ncbi:hypothetical protein H2200_005425 [Cladophialophora chaetospira]|uniref:Uncharacterized protein n=1 Tax=Cladophialophora chaetospira TaxID=386627 RepID=A0AA39CJW3_9EURO|nr:hypothetical protein H2200_005425 [Cladophialophora chaetospira]
MRAAILLSGMVAGLSTVVTAFPPFVPHHDHSAVACFSATPHGLPESTALSGIPSFVPHHSRSSIAPVDATRRGKPSYTALPRDAPNDNHTVKPTWTTTESTWDWESKLSDFDASLPLMTIPSPTQTEVWPGHAPPSFPFSVPSTLNTSGFTKHGWKYFNFSGPYEYSTSVPISTSNFPSGFPVTGAPSSRSVVTDTFGASDFTSQSTSTFTEVQTVIVTVTPLSVEQTSTTTDSAVLSESSVSAQASFTSTVTQITTVTNDSLPGSLPSSSVDLPSLTKTPDASIQITAPNPLSSDLSRASGFGSATSGSATLSIPSPSFLNSKVSSVSVLPVQSVLSQVNSVLGNISSILATKTTDTFSPASTFTSTSFSVPAETETQTVTPLPEGGPTPFFSLTDSVSGTTILPSTSVDSSALISSEINSIISALTPSSSSDAAVSSSSLAVPTPMSNKTDTPSSIVAATQFSAETSSAVPATESLSLPVYTVTKSPLPLTSSTSSTVGVDNLKARVPTTLATSTLPSHFPHISVQTCSTCSWKAVSDWTPTWPHQTLRPSSNPLADRSSFIVPSVPSGFHSGVTITISARSAATSTDDPFGSVLASISSVLAAGTPVESVISEVNSIISVPATSTDHWTIPSTMTRLPKPKYTNRSANPDTNWIIPSTMTRLPKPKFTDRSANPNMKLRDEAATPTDDGSVCPCTIYPGDDDKVCRRDCDCCMDWGSEVSAHPAADSNRVLPCAAPLCW